MVGGSGLRRTTPWQCRPQSTNPCLKPRAVFGTATWSKPNAELCDALLTYELPDSLDRLVQTVQNVFCRFPLFQQEMDEIAMYIGLEVRELRQAGVADYWTEPCFSNLCTVLDNFAQHPWDSDGGQQRTVEPAMETLRHFQSTVAQIQWETLLPMPESTNVTPEVSLILDDDWEVAVMSDSRLADVATVESSYWLLVPNSLREAWDAALTGAAVQLMAPAVFWRSPLAMPFVRMRATAH